MNEMKSNFKSLYTDFNSAVFKTEMETIFIKITAPVLYYSK